MWIFLWVVKRIVCPLLYLKRHISLRFLMDRLATRRITLIARISLTRQSGISKAASMYVLTWPFYQGQDVTQGQFLRRLKLVWIQSFPSHKISYLTKTEKPIVGWKRVDSYLCQGYYREVKLQNSSSRIWTITITLSAYTCMNIYTPACTQRRKLNFIIVEKWGAVVLTVIIDGNGFGEPSLNPDLTWFLYFNINIFDIHAFIHNICIKKMHIFDFK